MSISNTENKIGIPLEGFGEASRKASCEGIVLLKNDRNMLPFLSSDNISIFGRCQIDYYRSGTGSGGAVNVEYTSNLLDALRQQKDVRINEELAAVYESWIREHPFDNGGGAWAAEPWYQEDMPVSDELAASASENSNKAIVVFGRTAGEDQDNAPVEGSFLLTREELGILHTVTKHFDQVAVVLNVSNIIDMSWLDTLEYKDHICSVLYSWQGGSEGGNACACVLSGDVNPSGKLADTIASSIDDYPSTKNFGDEKENIYQEDLYVGYRYFETFAPEKVLFPFGYGKSYTDFELRGSGFQVSGSGKDTRIKVCVEIRNKGLKYAGKEVVQLYVEAPQGALGKPSRSLAGFAKSSLLAPQESEKLQIEVSVTALASYDDSGKTGHKSCWVLEPGVYRFYLGTDVRSAEPVCDDKDTFYLNDCLVTEQLEEALAPTKSYQRIRPGQRKENGTYEIAYEETPRHTISMAERICENLPADMPITGDRGITFRDVRDKKVELSEFVAQFSKEELSRIVRGEGMGSPLVTPGTASAFGGVAKSLRHYEIPAACASDGPSGIRMDSGLKATQLPIGTLLACTWNPALVEALYELEGRELLSNRVDTLLGPGINIHRNPLNGRNFEYFSEDPLLAGRFAAAVTRGIGRKGPAATVKHFACNSQEQGRNTANSVVSERALREVYLKGFELAVKEGQARSIMTSYNPINGHWSASNYDLCTTVLRRDWGYTGIVMTDWWAKMNDPVAGGTAGVTNTAAMVRAQNDLYMVVTNKGAEENAYGDNTLEAIEEGKLTTGELQRSAMNILNFILHSPVAERAEKDIAAEDGEDGLGAENIRFTTIRFLPKEQKSRQITLEQDGKYKILAKVKSDLSELAQSSTNICMNGQIVATIQSHGTDGVWNLIKVENVFLKAGEYEMTLETIKPGLEITWVDLTV